MTTSPRCASLWTHQPKRNMLGEVGLCKYSWCTQGYRYDCDSNRLVLVILILYWERLSAGSTYWIVICIVRYDKYHNFSTCARSNLFAWPEKDSYTRHQRPGVADSLSDAHERPQHLRVQKIRPAMAAVYDQSPFDPLLCVAQVLQDVYSMLVVHLSMLLFAFPAESSPLVSPSPPLPRRKKLTVQPVMSPKYQA